MCRWWDLAHLVPRSRMHGRAVRKNEETLAASHVMEKICHSQVRMQATKSRLLSIHSCSDNLLCLAGRSTIGSVMRCSWNDCQKFAWDGNTIHCCRVTYGV